MLLGRLHFGREQPLYWVNQRVIDLARMETSAATIDPRQGKGPFLAE